MQEICPKLQIYPNSLLDDRECCVLYCCAAILLCCFLLLAPDLKTLIILMILTFKYPTQIDYQTVRHYCELSLVVVIRYSSCVR